MHIYNNVYHCSVYRHELLHYYNTPEYKSHNICTCICSMYPVTRLSERRALFFLIYLPFFFFACEREGLDLRLVFYVVDTVFHSVQFPCFLCLMHITKGLPLLLFHGINHSCTCTSLHVYMHVVVRHAQCRGPALCRGGEGSWLQAGPVCLASG